MTNRKNQNSFLILTTLGVYFGLLLVGGSSQARAQAAEILRQAAEKGECDRRELLFEQATKLHVEAGLGNRGRTLATTYIDDFFDDLIDDLRSDRQNIKRSFIGEFLVERFSFDDIQISSKLRNDFRYGGASQSKSDFLAEKLFKIVEQISEASCDGNFRNCPNVSIRFAYNENGFESETRFSFQNGSSTNAALFANAHNLETRYEACYKSDNRIFENTKAHSENDQVFIVTRLPRAALDTLLSSRAK